MGPAWGPCLALALNAVCLGLWQGSTVPWLPGNGVHLLLGLALVNLAAILLVFRAFWKQPVWRSKVVWVVGASQGLGRELSLHFAKKGAHVILSARNAEALEEVKRACPVRQKVETGALVLPLDLCGPFSNLEDVCRQACSVHGGVDYVFQCVGASMSAGATEVSPEVIDKLFQVNTLGPIKLGRALVPLLMAQGPARPAQVVIISSMAGKVPSPGQSVYSACKMALGGYYTSLKYEIADTNVGVTMCFPGPVQTPQGADGSQQRVRSVYGPQGLVASASSEKGDKARMPTQECVDRIARAAYHRVDEAWISKQPVLGMAYVFQLLPALGRKVLKVVGPKRARAMREGKSGYSTGLLRGKKVAG